MTLPRFRLRTLMIAAPVAGIVLAIEAAAWIGSIGEGLVLVLLLSIAWVPAVSLLLDPKPAGWLFILVGSSLALSLYRAMLGGLGADRGFDACLASLWLTFAFGIGYVATRAGHLPDRRRAPDTRLERDSHAGGECENLDGVS
jgi:hypothetical protein